MKLKYLVVGALMALGAGAAAHATSIDFDSYATGTALTSVGDVSFSLIGGSDNGQTPLIGYGSAEPRGLSNSSVADYPTATVLDFSFASAVSGVSFYFNNYGDNGASFYQAFDGLGNLLESGALNSEDGFENNILSASGIKDLQFNNGEGGANWYFAVNSINYSGAVPEPTTWAMMFAGVGAIGMALRSSRRRQAVTA